MMVAIFWFILILFILVLAHEFGHFWTARKMGMGVEEFGIGFPPRIWSWKDKLGTTWSLNIIPLGGFVKIEGENSQDELTPTSFGGKRKSARALVLVAGVVMNMVLASGLYMVGFGFGLPTILNGEVPNGARVTNRSVRVIEVHPNSSAMQAGILTGDRIVSVNGVGYQLSEQARAAFKPLPPETTVTLLVERASEELSFELTPARLEGLEIDGVGVALMDTGKVHYAWYLAPFMGIVAAFRLAGEMIVTLGVLIAGLFSGNGVEGGLAGPVGIAVITGEVAKLGLGHILQFAAALSVNLAVLNILPIPALDGGRLLFLAIEAIRGKPLKKGVERTVHSLGFLALIILIIGVTYGDIIKLF